MKIPKEIKWIAAIWIGLIICGEMGVIGAWILFIVVVLSMGYICLKIFGGMLSGLLTPLGAIGALALKNKQNNDLQWRKDEQRRKDNEEYAAKIELEYGK